MFFQPRLSSKALAELCHRLAVETEAGIDVRRTWQREAENAPRHVRDDFVAIRDAINSGQSVSLSLARTAKLFPPLFLEMVYVGEQTGTLGRVYHRLSRLYQRQRQLRQVFLRSISWPMFQLAAALLVIGLLIYVLGVIGQSNRGQPIDVLGLGLVGTRGLVIYINAVVVVGLCVTALVVAVQRGLLWTRPLQRAVMRLPMIGSCLQKLALARLTWALHLTLSVAMDLRRVVPQVLRATGNHYYIRHSDDVVARITAGQPLHEALAHTGAFPEDFIEAMAVGEGAGQIVEAMERLSNRYEEEAESAMRTLTVILGFLVWCLVAAVIILAIFRLAGFYIGTIQEALTM